MIQDALLLDIVLIIILGAIIGFFARWLKQPLIPAYVIAGLILGPITGFIHDTEVIRTLSELGIAFLLFIVGLEINLKQLRDVGMVVTIGGLAKSIVLFSLGYFIALVAGIRGLEMIYVGLILVFSSTMVVVKLLSDKKHIDTLHGRIILGFLILEDILAVFAMVVLSSLDQFSFGIFLIALWKTALLFLIAVALNKWVFPKVFSFAAKSQELLFLTAVSVCFLFALLFASLDFSISIGAFVGGVTLASLPYSYEIIGRIRSMRDFFATIFFVSLGMSIVPIAGNYIWVVVGMLGVVWVLKPFITMFITSFFGYKERPSFLTAINLAQTSEFSLIIVTQGLILGHVTEEIFSIAAIVAVITMSVSSYLIEYEMPVYQKVKKRLHFLDHFTAGMQPHLGLTDEKLHYDVLLVGYDRIGYSIKNKLHIMKKNLLVVDYNPEVIRRLTGEKIHCLYGDISDPEIIERIDLREINMAISTSPDINDNKLFMNHIKAANEKAMIFLTAYRVQDALELYKSGADYVILPHLLGGDHASLLIEKYEGDAVKLSEHKLAHIADLKKQHQFRNGHHHGHPHH